MVSVRHSLLSLFGFTTGKELLVISTDKALDELPWHCSNLSRDWALYKIPVEINQYMQNSCI